MEENKKNNILFKSINCKWLVVAGLIIVSIVVVIFLIIELDNNKYDEYRSESYRAIDYNDFMDKYGEYAEEFDVTEHNYRHYEREAFMLKYSDQISFEEEYVPEDKTMYVFLSNNSEFEYIGAEIGVVYYDINGVVVDVETTTILDLEKGIIRCETIENEISTAVEAKVIVKAFESYNKTGAVKDLEYEAKEDKKRNKIYLKCTNNGNKEVSYINGCILFYDKEDKILFNDYIYLNNKIKPKETIEEDLSLFLYNKEYDHYRIFINSATGAND